MYESILVAHLIGACATALLVLCTLFALHKRSASFYHTSAVTLGSLAAFEIASGTLLAVLSTELSVGMVCNRIAVYLLVVGCTLAMLFYRMKKSDIEFPAGITLTPVSTSLASLFLAAILGF